MAKAKKRKRRSQWYVESDGAGPYIVEEKHGRIATIECESFKSNGGPADWKRAVLMAHAPIMFDDLLQLANAAETLVNGVDAKREDVFAENLVALHRAAGVAKATIVSAIRVKTPKEAE